MAEQSPNRLCPGLPRLLSRYSSLLRLLRGLAVRAASSEAPVDHAVAAACYAYRLASEAEASVEAAVLAALLHDAWRLLGREGEGSECSVEGVGPGGAARALLEEAGVQDGAAVEAVRALEGADPLLTGIVRDADSLAKMGAYGLLDTIASRARRGSLVAAVLAAAARQLTFTANLDETMCTEPGRRLARQLSRRLRESVGRLLAELAAQDVKLQAHTRRTGKTTVVALIPRQCPNCRAELHTRVEEAPPQGRCTGGLRVEAVCPACGWKLAYTVCAPPCRTASL